MYEAIQQARRNLQKSADIMDFGAGMEEPVVGMEDTPVVPSDQYNHSIEQDISEPSEDKPKLPGKPKAKTTKMTEVQPDGKPTAPPTPEKSDVGPVSSDSPATLQVGEGSVESLGNILNILRQLNI